MTTLERAQAALAAGRCMWCGQPTRRHRPAAMPRVPGSCLATQDQLRRLRDMPAADLARFLQLAPTVAVATKAAMGGSHGT